MIDNGIEQAIEEFCGARTPHYINSSRSNDIIIGLISEYNNHIMNINSLRHELTKIDKELEKYEF